MIHGLDHIVILVADLDAAIADYTTLGFSVVVGGEHPGGATHNALVIFADGVYLELIAFKQPQEDHIWWARSRRADEGLIDYALLPGSTPAVGTAARQRGLELIGPTAGGRVRPAGGRLTRQTARSATPDLPFLCGDLTPRSLRAPEGGVRRHANRVRGVAGITIAVRDLGTSLSRYQALLGDAATLSGAAVQLAGLGVAVATLNLAGSNITLAAAHGSGPAGEVVQAHIDRIGEGPFAFALQTDAPHVAARLDPTLTHGAIIDLV